MRLSIVLALLVAGCSADPVSPDVPEAFADEADYQQRREAAAAALADAITPATASGVGACRVVPTSEQACGGPTTFAVYSSESPEAADVERLADRLVRLDRLANQQFEYASTCMAYTPPTPVLRDGECVADR